MFIIIELLFHRITYNYKNKQCREQWKVLLKKTRWQNVWGLQIFISLFLWQILWLIELPSIHSCRLNFMFYVFMCFFWYSVSYIDNFLEISHDKMIITAVLFSPYVACCVGLSKTTLFIISKTDENIMRCKTLPVNYAEWWRKQIELKRTSVTRLVIASTGW